MIHRATAPIATSVGDTESGPDLGDPRTLLLLVRSTKKVANRPAIFIVFEMSVKSSL
jgi:hypothetical protein